MNVVSNECGLKWMWSQMNVVSNEGGLKWRGSQMKGVSNECGLNWMWSQKNVVLNECGLKWMWSQMNWSQMNVVSNDCGLKWIWFQMNVVSHECGLEWMWSRMNVVSNECGLKWMWSCFEQYISKLYGKPSTIDSIHILYPNFTGFPFINCLVLRRPRFGTINSSVLRFLWNTPSGDSIGEAEWAMAPQIFAGAHWLAPPTAFFLISSLSLFYWPIQ